MSNDDSQSSFSEDQLLQPGREIGNYRVVGFIGEGGMAMVYQVEHKVLGSLHALKVLSGGAKGVRERLLQEGRAQATLQHRNVVSVTDVVDVDGDPGLVMQYVEGYALDEILDQGPIPRDVALQLFVGIMRGVRHAHKRGLVHRDLKPANIMVKKTDDGRLSPKVMDFGLVKALNDTTSGGKRRTRTGAAMGTPDYMAPEQIHDASTVDRRADMWSLGVILYELMCHDRPFQGEAMLQIFNAVTRGEYISPVEHCPDLAPGIVEAIDSMLVVDPNERLDNCDAVMQLFANDPFTGTDAGTSGSGWMRDNASGEWRALPNAPRVPRASNGAGTWSSRADYSSFAPPEVGHPWKLYAAIGVASVLSMVVGAIGAKTWLGDKLPPPAQVEAASPEPMDEPAVADVDEPAAEPEADAEDAPNTDPEPISAPSPPEPVGSAAPSAPAVAEAPAEPVAQKAAPPPLPVPAPVATGSVTAKGDARSVWVQANGQRIDLPGEVPAGTWTVHAWFNAPEPVEAGTITVSAGVPLELKCSSFVNRCK